MTYTFPPADEQLAYLKKGVAEVIREDELKARLEKSLKTGKPLARKLGLIPRPRTFISATPCHSQAQTFQDLGHTAVFLIGDFTALGWRSHGPVRDAPAALPRTGQDQRQDLSRQVFKLLDPKKTEVRYNSEWLDKLSSYDIVRLCAKYRVARMLEHEDFSLAPR